jgi:cyclophilin family peptidyl-prolyl cis-trans isomerase
MADPAAVEAAKPPPTERVRMITSAGNVVIELDRERAPLSVTNFLQYADAGEYNGTIFHRVLRDFVIQGGGYSPELTERKSFGTIRNEWQNGLKNVRGTIAMARETDPDSATREFFINCVDNAKLDEPRPISGNAGYAVFGRVVEGMDVVDKIRMLQVTTRPGFENIPVNPPIIQKIERLR